MSKKHPIGETASVFPADNYKQQERLLIHSLYDPVIRIENNQQLMLKKLDEEHDAALQRHNELLSKLEELHHDIQEMKEERITTPIVTPQLPLKWPIKTILFSTIVIGGCILGGAHYLKQ